ncbi:hypothetical protein DCAR_0832366 [Daucus carota subsp. sativus]|uniref:SWIM-type domain-containing protein n=1 Tax=Daucus carota subsp. sativus TaxID=79200 RepID=A0AAF0XT58_DAUCS|nr:hypothetical protein DCAR_0832366 [Daucus carota subsp. sativus]
MAATATHPVAHQNAMKQIENISKPAYEALKKIDPKMWSKAFISTHSNADNVENNLSECFNAWIVKQSTRAVRVDLSKKSCDCRIFDLTGIPCSHAIAAIHDKREQPVDYVSNYYKRDAYLTTYSYSLEALKGEDYWEVQPTEKLLPPVIPKKLRGRPKRLRRKEGWEGGTSRQTRICQIDTTQVQRFSQRRIMHCSICRKSGHRKTKCPLKSVDQETRNAQSEGENAQSVHEGNRQCGDQNARRSKLPIRKGTAKGAVLVSTPETTWVNKLPSETSSSNVFDTPFNLAED